AAPQPIRLAPAKLPGLSVVALLLLHAGAFQFQSGVSSLRRRDAWRRLRLFAWRPPPRPAVDRVPPQRGAVRPLPDVIDLRQRIGARRCVAWQAARAKLPNQPIAAGRTRGWILSVPPRLSGCQTIASEMLRAPGPGGRGYH